MAYRILIIAYFDLNKNLQNQLGTSIADMLELVNINQATNMRAKVKYLLLIDCLMWLIENNYIEIIHNKKNIIKRVQLINVKFLDKITITILPYEFYPVIKQSNKYDFQYSEPFTIINYDEFYAITQKTTDKTIYHFFSYLIVKKLIGWRPKGKQNVRNNPKAAVITQQFLSKYLDCAPSTAFRYLNFLVENKLLVRKEIKLQIKGKANPYIYALNEPGWEEEIKYGIEKFRKAVNKQ